MKKLLIVLVLVLSLGTYAQRTEYKIVGKEIVKIKAKKDIPTVKPERTEYVYKSKDSVIHTVYRGSRGSYYIIRTAKKSGKSRKQYLKITETK